MNLEASTKPESITQIAAPEQLVAAREARGWSMSDIAAKLGMMPRQIGALEQGQWDALPGHAFVRGAIRAYGKALQVDVAPLLATLGGTTNAPELRASSSLDSPLPRHGALGFDNGGSGSRIVWILLGVIGVIAIAMYFGRGADFGQVLEPGSGLQPGRAVDVVPLTPGLSSGSETDATRGSTGASRQSGTGGTASGGGTSGAAPSGATSGGTAVGDGAAGGAAAGGAAAGGAAAGVATSGGAASGGAASGGAASGGAALVESPSGSSAASGTPSASMPAGSAISPGAASTGASQKTGAAAGSMASGGATSAPDSGAPVPAAAGAVGTTTGTTQETSAMRPAADVPAKGASAATTAGDPVVLHFERESWVEVRDATGRTLLLGTQPANSTREVSGQKPFSMTIGNATFVRVEHGGRNIDLGAVTQKGVARVRVE